ncbi:MAG: hypothetical protein E7626_06095 [Ruminococcaceae bacterium]|nr:hypothetical protein [Oscillospiraceae bacterium]
MKKLKTLLSILLLLSLALGMFAACKDDDADQKPEAPQVTDISQYSIVRPEDADEELIKFVTLFKQEMLRYTKTNLPVRSDDIPVAEGAKEILIGETNRPESAAAKSALAKAPDNAFTVRATENSIVIAAKSDAGLIRAMKYFYMTYGAECDVDASLALLPGHVHNGTVDLDSLILDNYTEIIDKVTSTIAICGRDFDTTCGYETLIQLNHNGENNGTLFASYADYSGYGYRIFKSTDEGKTWKHISTAIDTFNDSMTDRDNPTKHKADNVCLQPCLYELPCDMGDFKEGTLFLGACSKGTGYYNKMETYTSSMTLYYSTDLGVTWKSYCNVDLAGNADAKNGVWEPFFIYDEATGRVYCYYSDESDEEGKKNGSGAQRLVFKYSTDMKTWVGQDGKTGVTDTPFYAIDASNSDAYNFRPGMISIAKMGNGEYFMTYEMCGISGCPIYYKKTTDLANWPNVSDYGKPVKTADGYTFGSAPWCAWTPAGGECGTLVVVAHHNQDKWPITLDQYGKVKGTDMLLSFDYGETFVAIKNPIPYYTFEKTSYSPFVGFSEDGHTFFYLNNPPDDKQSYQKVIFKSMKIW